VRSITCADDSPLLRAEIVERQRIADAATRVAELPAGVHARLAAHVRNVLV
jgi:hypothetical protein